MKAFPRRWKYALGIAAGLLALPVVASAAKADACQVWRDIDAYTDASVHGLTVQPHGRGCEATGKGSDVEATLRQLLALSAVSGQRCAFDQTMKMDSVDSRSFRLRIIPREDGGCTAPVQALEKEGPHVWDLHDVQPPRYTMDAWNRGFEGVTLVTVLIDAEGRVAAAVLASSSGSPQLDAIAFEAASASRFRRKESAAPATGLSVARIPFHFNIPDSGSR